MRKRIAIPLLVVALSVSVQAQTIQIEGRVYAGVEAGCWLLRDVHTGTAFELYGGGPDLYRADVWAIVWGSVSALSSSCMQGVPFDVTSYSVLTDCHDGNACTDDFFSAGACQHVNNTAPCDDGNACTENDRCSEGSCVGTPVSCDDGNPCTVDECVVGECSNTPIGGGEQVVVGLPELVGSYLFNGRVEEFSLGFTPFEVGCVAVDWAGGIHTSTVDCVGGPQGFGGTLSASFMEQPSARATYSETTGEPSAWIPFDRKDVFADEPFDALQDGRATLQGYFEHIIQECTVVEPASAVLDRVNLIISARRMHDFDNDGHVDVADALAFGDCIQGPDNPVGPECLVFDADRDGDADLGDFAGLLKEFTGPMAGSGPANDSCSTPQAIGDGTISFITDGATTDSISIVETCAPAAPIQWAADVWFRYQAACTGTATVSLCGSRYDTTAAVYEGGGCPSVAALVCNDDGCGSGADAPSSRVTFPAVEGNNYMIRIGGFVGALGADTGTGSLTIYCGNDSGRGPENCGLGSSDCFTVDPTPTCSDADCCRTICALDPYCCDVEWDSVCVEEGVGICGDGFAACTGATGDCFQGHSDQSPGCEIQGCCQTVCEQDPFCCVNFWDDFCAQDATAACSVAKVCAGALGSCTMEHATPGCDNPTCCEAVCLDDPFCCTSEWDATCVASGVSCR